ncbi:MAG: hypothetical protein AB8B80_09495 [Marinicellaceae bacterium]
MNTYIAQLKNKQWMIGFLFVLLVNTFTSLNAQERPILEMVSYSSKLLKPDLTPNVRIFANGGIEVYRPMYMKKSGFFSTNLNDNELNEVIKLMDSLEKFDVIKAEEDYFNADLENKRLTGQLYYTSETVITQFKINRVGDSLSDEKLILAESARDKSNRFTQLSDWKVFAEAEYLMMKFMNKNNLIRIGDAKDL